MKLCEVCPKRNRCEALCKKAEDWVSKDHKSQREWTGFENRVSDGGEDPKNTATVLELLAFEAEKGGGSLLTQEGSNVQYQTGSRVSWQVIQNAAHTPFPEYPFLRDIENKILQAFYSEGLSYKQIARKYKKKYSAVKSILARAEEKIASKSSKKGMGQQNKRIVILRKRENEKINSES